MAHKTGAIFDTGHIPTTLKEFGIVESDFLEKLTMISERAIEDTYTGSNPRPITVGEMEI